MSTIVILDGKGGRLANQLWLYASVYSFCLEKKYACKNYNFFKYNKYFKINAPNWLNIFSLLPHKIAGYFYKLFIILPLRIFRRKYNVVHNDQEEFFLPPTISSKLNQQEIIKKIEYYNHKTFYFNGWLFRNPEGLKKFHKEIQEYFKPRQEYVQKAGDFIASLKKKYRKIIGVHIRHGDYKTWNDGKYFYSFQEVRQILNQFLGMQENRSDIAFILCSDAKIESIIFDGLNYVEGPGNEIEDLYALSRADMVIGSNSTFGSWAAFYGNIPFVQFSKQPIEWPHL